MENKKRCFFIRAAALLVLVIAVSACIVSCSGCGDRGENDMIKAVGGKTYVWEKPGAGGNFTVTLFEDGTFQYYAGFYSSYIGLGDWTLEDGIVTLRDHGGYDFVFRFSVQDGELRYLKEGSDQFMYVNVEDGDRFIPAETAEKPVIEENNRDTFTIISQEKAREMMEKDDGHVIVDVRRRDEYDAGHIPGAVLIPNESIGSERPRELPDLEQIILVYCRSGRRSKEAAQKLFDLGYRNVYEFGGIIDWTGETEMSITDPAPEVTEPVAQLVIEVNGKIFYASLEDNTSAKAFAEKLDPAPLSVDMHDYGNFEKVGDLPWTLPRNDEEITTEPGDIILYNGSSITIYYGQNTWNFTRLAKIENTGREELLSALGAGDVTVKFWLEWSE